MSIALEILQHTNDGDDLSPSHLYLLQGFVNNGLNEQGVEKMKQIHREVMAGNYKKPWLCGVEHLATASPSSTTNLGMT